jgi:hypothetical protein
MRPVTVAFLLSAGLAGLTTACTDPGGDDDVTTEPTWYRDVAPILAEHCMGCHRDGGIAPFSMETYELAAPAADQMLEAVETGIMPPWDAESSESCTPRHGWKNDNRLSAHDTQVLRDWIAAGKPEGTAAAIPPPPSIDLEGVTHSATPSTPYVTTGDADEFICFLLDPGVTRLSWMTGIQVVPGNPKVVHHAVVVGYLPGASLDADLQANGLGRPFTCNGGAVTRTDTFLMGVWTPGSQPFETPTELGLAVPAGSHVLVQMHYHPGGALTNEPDASTVRLRLQTIRPPNTYTIGAVGNAASAPILQPDPDDRGVPEFRIPANATAHVESMRFPLSTLPDGRFRLFAAYPHMHYIGVELEVQVEHPRAGGGVDRECLVNVPRWNFDWQRTYQYEAPYSDLPTIGNGDVLTVRCSYDNSLANPFVRRGLEELGLIEPIDVYLGEESLDEMCLGIFGIVVEPV